MSIIGNGFCSYLRVVIKYRDKSLLRTLFFMLYALAQLGGGVVQKGL